MIWRLVMEKVATKSEIDESYTLVDILQAVEILDYQADLQKKELDKQRSQAKHAK